MAHKSNTNSKHKSGPPPGMTVLDWTNSPEYLLERVGPELQKTIDKIKKLMEKDRRNIIMARYDLGLLVKEVDDDTTERGGDNRRYGLKAMDTLRAAVPWSRSLIYEALMFVQIYSQEEAERLSALHTKSGQPIFWSHVRTLITITNRNVRDELLQRTIQEDWTCDELGKAVMQQKESRDSVAPQKIKGPRNLNGMIEQQRAYADHFLERAEAAWNNPAQSLTNLSKGLPADKYTQEGADKLKDLAEQLRLVAREAEVRAKDAQTAYERYVEAMHGAKPKARVHNGPETESSPYEEQQKRRIEEQLQAKLDSEFFDLPEDEDLEEEKEEEELGEQLAA